MLRVLVLLGCLVSWSGFALAEDAVATAKTALEKAKTQHDATVERAHGDLVAAVTREIKRQRANKQRSVADQLARIELLEAAQKALETEHALPQAEEFLDAVQTYKEVVRKSRIRCEKAFDAYAQRCVAAKDDVGAKQALKEKSKFFLRKFTLGEFQVTTEPPFGRAVVELKPDGTYTQNQDDKYTTSGTWEQTKDDELVITSENTAYGTVTLKMNGKDYLAGPNVHANGNRWTWKMVRLSKVTFPPGVFRSTTVPDEGEWTWTLKNDGTHVNSRDDYHYSGTWEQVGEEIVFHFAGSNYVDNVFSTGHLKIEDNDHLSGSLKQNDGRSWKWTVVRLPEVKEPTK